MELESRIFSVNLGLEAEKHRTGADEYGFVSTDLVANSCFYTHFFYTSSPASSGHHHGKFHEISSFFPLGRRMADTAALHLEGLRTNY